MSWDSTVIVTDDDLGRLEPEAVSPDQPWGDSSWPTQIEHAKRQLRVWVDADNPTIFAASDRIRDRFPAAHVKGYTGSAYTDYQTEAADATEEDIPLATVLGTPASDRLYVGSTFAATGLFLHTLDSVNAASSTATVKYWAVNQWQAVPSQSDGTAVSGATVGQSGVVSWAPITDWERRSLDGSDEGLYWLELSVDNALTAGTALSHALLVRRPDGLRLVATMLALSYVMRGLAAQSTEPGEWRERADAYMDDAVGLYASLKSTSMIPLDIDLSGGVEATESGAAALGRMPRA